MKTNYNIEQEIEKTLNSVGSFERYNGKPFLLTRVQAQLAKNDGYQPGFISRLALKPAFLVAIIVLNVFSAIYFMNSSSTIDTTRDQYLDQLAEEYMPSSKAFEITTLLEEE